MMRSAAGARSAVVRLMAALATRNPAAQSARSVQAAGFRTSRCRVTVRGFFWSSDQSLSRLKSMAAVRARTMQTRTRSSVRGASRPLAATRRDPKAKGRAKMVWEKRTSRRNRATGLDWANASAGAALIFAILLITGKKLLQPRARPEENRGPVRKEDAVKGIVQQLSQGAAHQLRVEAIF